MCSCTLSIQVALSPREPQWHSLLFWKMLCSVASSFNYFNYLRVASATFRTRLNKNFRCEQEKYLMGMLSAQQTNILTLKIFKANGYKTEYKYLFSWKFAALGFIILSYPHFNFRKYAQKPWFVTERRRVDIVTMETKTYFFCSKNVVY